jgi:hypothetical protein
VSEDYERASKELSARFGRIADRIELYAQIALEADMKLDRRPAPETAMAFRRYATAGVERWLREEKYGHS